MTQAKKAKHTPGPWRLGTQFSCHTVIDGPNRAVATTLCNYALVDSGEDAANARLIAAAPELAEELRDLIDLARTAMREADWKCDIEECLNTAKAALNKAGL